MPKQEGRNMIMVIAPNRRYLEQQERARLREGISEDGAALEPALEPGSEPELEPEPEPEPVGADPATESDEG
jgi:hypothetical protein